MVAIRQIENVEISWGARTKTAELKRIDRRVLRIEVKPTGDVIVFAPLDADLETIKARISRKKAWIFREIDKIEERPAVTPERRYISGETHLFLGRQYRLSIEQGDDAYVCIAGGRLVIRAKRVDDQAHCRRLLTTFYNIAARKIFRERLDEIAPAFLRKGLKRPILIVRKLSKRWGSYTPKGRIILNVDLVRAAPTLIDYVICHELAHAFYPDHGTEWKRLFDAIMPDWEARKSRLEAELR